MPPIAEKQNERQIIKFESSNRSMDANANIYRIISNDPIQQPLILFIRSRMKLLEAEVIILNVAKVAIFKPRYILSIFFSIRNLGKKGAIQQYAMFDMHIIVNIYFISLGNLSFYCFSRTSSLLSRSKSCISLFISNLK